MTNFYVDNTIAASGNGGSWQSAWRTFADINWGVFKPGDTLFISGGTTGQTYNETLSPAASGAAGLPITITAGIDPGHNGTVIIDGQNVRANGVSIYGHDYLDVSHLDIRNHADAGVQVKYATA